MSDLSGARLSFTAAIVGCVTYGIYVVLAAICVHFLIRREIHGRPHRVVLAYTLVMFAVTTIYFVTACKWSEVEFVESTADIGAFAALQSSRLALVKNTAFTLNIWLADSLLIYRLFVIWSGYIPILVLPCALWVGAVATGTMLLIAFQKPQATLDQTTVINYNTSFYACTVSLNILCTLAIAARLWAQQRRARRLGASGSVYSSLMAVIVESAALYSLCGIVYMPLTVRADPVQYPFSALIGSLTAISPNLIILRMALGSYQSMDTTTKTGASFKLSSLRSPQDAQAAAAASATLTTGSELDSKTNVSLSVLPGKYGGEVVHPLRSVMISAAEDRV